MTNSLGKKTNGGLLYAISISFEEQASRDTPVGANHTRGKNKTRLWFYVYAHPLKSNLPGGAARDRILILMHLASNNERHAVVGARNAISRRDIR